ncbi:MAG: hypothetical protein AVDCRST_MAG59-5126, partial [uncultured Thermomicrobiales bacterium]
APGQPQSASPWRRAARHPAGGGSPRLGRGSAGARRALPRLGSGGRQLHGGVAAPAGDRARPPLERSPRRPGDRRHHAPERCRGSCHRTDHRPERHPTADGRRGGLCCTEPDRHRAGADLPPPAPPCRRRRSGRRNPLRTAVGHRRYAVRGSRSPPSDRLDLGRALARRHRRGAGHRRGRWRPWVARRASRRRTPGPDRGAGRRGLAAGRCGRRRRSVAVARVACGLPAAAAPPSDARPLRGERSAGRGLDRGPDVPRRVPGRSVRARPVRSRVGLHGHRGRRLPRQRLGSEPVRADPPALAGRRRRRPPGGAACSAVRPPARSGDGGGGAVRHGVRRRGHVRRRGYPAHRRVARRGRDHDGVERLGLQSRFGRRCRVRRGAPGGRGLRGRGHRPRLVRGAGGAARVGNRPLRSTASVEHRWRWV